MRALFACLTCLLDLDESQLLYLHVSHLLPVAAVYQMKAFYSWNVRKIIVLHLECLLPPRVAIYSISSGQTLRS